MGSEENDRHEAVLKYCYPIASLRAYLNCYFMLLCLRHWKCFWSVSNHFSILADEIMHPALGNLDFHFIILIRISARK